MGDKTGIEWTDATWNPVTGCDKVSPGCDHCYAMKMAKRLKAMGSAKYQTDGDPRTSGPGFGVARHPGTLAYPLTLKEPTRIFVNSMSDLFHDKVPDEYIAEVFAVMACAYQHTFQVLTKRHGRMKSLLSSADFVSMVDKESLAYDRSPLGHRAIKWPLRNVWLGVSAENQQWADIRIPALLDTPAAVRFVSGEPLLGPIELKQHWLHPVMREPSPENHAVGRRIGKANGVGFIDWVIVGGESGPGARPMHPDWARSLRDQCVAAGVPFLFKQWGEWAPNQHPPLRACVCDWYDGREADICRNDPCRKLSKPPYVDDPRAQMQRVGKKRAGRELDGRTWDQYPEAVTNA
ncbi:phage Gp37/Gp68 family protein [Mycobacteroides chelonae]|jgi:protein gp37|nr:phage Gp37/Gp68 family protein [Mycobacteroides chelonae]